MLLVITVDRKANSSLSSKINSIVIYLPVLIVNVIFLKGQLIINHTKIFTGRFWFNLWWDFEIIGAFIMLHYGVGVRLSDTLKNFQIPSWTNPVAYPFSLCWIILCFVDFCFPLFDLRGGCEWMSCVGKCVLWQRDIQTICFQNILWPNLRYRVSHFQYFIGKEIWPLTKVFWEFQNETAPETIMILTPVEQVKNR